MPHKIVKLHFQGPLRIGEPGIGIENTSPFVHSDTLFSALCHAWVLLRGERWVSDFLEVYRTKPSFVLSSAFPFMETSFYLPRPFCPILWEEKEVQAKELKTLRWLSYTSLDQVFSGSKVSLEKVKTENKTALAIQRKMLTPRVALGRNDMASELFFCGQTYFTEGAGLYGVIHFLDEGNSFALLKEAFGLLGEEGLGAERNSGLGHFTPEWIEPDATWQSLFSRKGARYYLASLFWTDPQTLPKALSGSNYDLIERRGWFYSASTGTQMKRKSVWMFAEGSVLDFLPQGALVDLAPEAWKNQGGHPVYRCGMAFVLSF